MVIGDIEWMDTKARPIIFLLQEETITDEQVGRPLTLGELNEIVREDPTNEAVAILFELVEDAPNSDKFVNILREMPKGLKWVSWLNTPRRDKPRVVVIHQDLNRRVEQEILALYVCRTYHDEMELDYRVMFLSSTAPIEELAA